ncbi:MAG TPA: hypothetical protein VII94_06300 [Candidatus Saccharimonadales bacterium]
MTLFAISSISSGDTPIKRILHVYKSVPECVYSDTAVLQSSIVYAAWAAKYVVYTFDENRFAHIILFMAYNDDCTFSLQFDKNTHECLVEFTVNDNSFNYDNFRKIMDSFLLP